MVQHYDPPYRAIGYSYTYRIYVFQAIAGNRAIPPLGGYRKIMLSLLKEFSETRSALHHTRGGGLGGGGLSQLKAALCAIGCYRVVSQLYCRKSRFNGPLSSEGRPHTEGTFTGTLVNCGTFAGTLVKVREVLVDMGVADSPTFAKLRQAEP